MGFRGPSRGIDTTALTLPINLQRQQEQDSFDRALRDADVGLSRGRLLRQSIDADNEQRQTREAGRARLAMTPGVRQGGAGSRWGMTVADSPALRPRSFRQFDQDYSYDPVAAGEQEGAARGVAQNTEEATRMEALKRIPGLTPRQASRLVYGRTGVMDEEDPSVLRTALSDYLRTPSREAAARAIEAGASANTFPDRFFLPEGEAEPRRGTPEYMAMRRAELEQSAEVETEALGRQAPIRARASAEVRQPTRERLQRVTGPNGEIGILNLDTQEVDWTGEMGAKPGSSGSMLDDLLAPPKPAAPVAAPAVAPTAAPESTATSLVPDDREREAFTLAYRALRARGIKDPTAAQVRAEMTRGRP